MSQSAWLHSLFRQQMRRHLRPPVLRDLWARTNQRNLVPILCRDLGLVGGSAVPRASNQARHPPCETRTKSRPFRRRRTPASPPTPDPKSPDAGVRPRHQSPLLERKTPKSPTHIRRPAVEASRRGTYPSVVESKRQGSLRQLHTPHHRRRERHSTASLASATASVVRHWPIRLAQRGGRTARRPRQYDSKA